MPASIPIHLDFLHIAFGVAAFLLLVVALVARVSAGRSQRRCEALEDELRRLRSKPEKHEMRLDRFDLVWFPTVTVSPSTMEITGVSPGVPHCRSCVAPLTLQQTEWGCQLCSSKYPESLADVQVSDQITQEALKYFQQRHKGFKIAIRR